MFYLFVVYWTTQWAIQTTVSNDLMNNEQWSGKDMQGSNCYSFKLLSPQMSGGTDKNHEKFQNTHSEPSLESMTCWIQSKLSSVNSVLVIQHCVLQKDFACDL
jgi:hypothetical protein